MRKNIFFDHAPSDGGSPATSTAPAAPPAAQIVACASPDENKIAELEAQLADTRRTLASTEQQKRDRELNVAQLQDQIRTLTAAPGKKDNRSCLEKFMNGEEV